MSTSIARQPHATDTSATETETTDNRVTTMDRKSVTVDRDALWEAMDSLRCELGDLDFFQHHEGTEEDNLALLTRQAATLAHLTDVLRDDALNRPSRPQTPWEPVPIDIAQLRRTLDITFTEYDDQASDVPLSGRDLWRFVEVARAAVNAVDLSQAAPYTEQAAEVLYDLAERGCALTAAARAMGAYTKERASGMFDVMAAMELLRKGIVVNAERRGADRPMQGQEGAEGTGATDDSPDAARAD